MSKQSGWIRSNHRIVIDVTGHPWVCDGKDQNQKYTESHAEDLMKILRPMADNISSYYGNPRLESDRFCRFCDSNWDDSLDENGAPICCQKAVDLHGAAA